MRVPEYKLPPELYGTQRRSLLVGAGSLVLCLIGALLNPQQFFRSYLLAYVFWVGIPLGCLAILMLQYLSGGMWGAVIRRLLESGTKTLPLMGLLFVPLVFGLRDLYAWARPEEVARDPLLQHKSLYLNVPFFLARTVFYFVAWIGVAHFLNKWSLEQDQLINPGRERRFRLLSGPGLVLYGLGVTFASIDWVMSLEPHWYSTIYGALFIVGRGLLAFAFVITVAALLVGRVGTQESASLQEVMTPARFHDLGNLLLAFVMLWAYMAFSQFLIIWSGNLTEEVPWYVHRVQGGWGQIALLLILFHFAVPFFLLLLRGIKRNPRALAIVAGAVIVMRVVDMYWLVVPAFHPGNLYIHWMDFLALIGLGGIWFAAFIWQLKKRPLLPLHDPTLQEALEHE